MSVGLVTGHRRDGQSRPAVDVHLAADLHLAAAVVVDVGAIVPGNDPHLRRVVVDDEHAAPTQRHEREAPIAGGAGADRGVVWTQFRVLTWLARRDLAAGEIESRPVVESEGLVRVVGADALKQLAVLIGHDQVPLVWRRPGGVRLGAHVDAADRLPRLGVEEGNMSGGQEGQSRVGVAARAVVVAAVENEHVRTLRRRSGLLLAHGLHGAGETRSSPERPRRHRGRARARRRCGAFLRRGCPCLPGRPARPRMSFGDGGRRERPVPALATTAAAAVQTRATSATRSRRGFMGSSWMSRSRDG